MPKITSRDLCYLVLSLSLILLGCHQPAAIIHHVLATPQTQISASSTSAPSSIDNVPEIPESPAPHMIKAGMPLTIGPGYTCVILAKTQLAFLHATVIKNAKLTCTSSAYEISDNNGMVATRFFLAIDNPTTFSHPDNTRITVDQLDAVVERVEHECQIVVDVLPNAIVAETLHGRIFSILVSNYVIPDKDNYICAQAQRISSYLIPYVLG